MQPTDRLPDRLLRRPLSNVTCPYCGSALAEKTRTKEHVVGRRFVPIGSLNDCWNLILWACRTCNRRKSDLEDDIAAITMHFHTAGLSSMADSRAQGEAKRRSAKSGSRTTGKSVAQSHASLEFAAPLGAGGQLKFKFDGPPQLDDARVYELARLQMMGFFYFLTYDRSRNVGHYWPGDFFPIHGTIKSDWGNALHRAFMKETGGWNYRIVLNTASGYYRAMIRRYPKADCWAWAVEWNDCYRLVGFFGDQTPAKAVADELPSVPVLSMREPNGGVIRYRVEESLRDEEDTLFRMPLEAED